MKHSDKTELTDAYLRALKREGYFYVTIKDVEVCEHSGKITSLTVNFMKQLPAIMRQSCTGIDDPMLVSLMGTAKIWFDTAVLA